MPINIFPQISPWDALVTLGVLILIFLAIREILTWYWKIDHIVSLLEDIKENTKGLKGENNPPNSSTPKSP